MTKQDQLNQIATEIIDRRLCLELADQASQLVLGEGNPDADIVLIGEAPGKKEDEMGRPFVGASGRFLNEMLAAAGWSRDEVYVTNIVKYRPPGNRDPKPAEKQAFWPYLARQLEIIDPKVVVTLGRHSMEFFLPDAKISQLHGQAVRRQVVWPDGSTRQWLIVPLYHPAAALYNGSMRTTLVEDFQQLSSIVDKKAK